MDLLHWWLYSLEGAEWVSNKGLWRMPMSQYGALMKTLPAVPGVRLDIEPLPTVAQALVQVHSIYLATRKHDKNSMHIPFVSVRLLFALDGVSCIQRILSMSWLVCPA